MCGILYGVYPGRPRRMPLRIAIYGTCFLVHRPDTLKLLLQLLVVDEDAVQLGRLSGESLQTFAELHRVLRPAGLTWCLYGRISTRCLSDLQPIIRW